VKLGGVPADASARLYASAVREEAGQVVVKLVNATAAPATIALELAGARGVEAGTLTVLRADDPESTNSLDAPDRVAPVTRPFAPAGAAFELTLAPHSFSVLRLGVR